MSALGSWTEHDWFHNNAVWYDKKTHSLTLSGRHQDIIINLDYESGELNWVIGDPEGWPEDFVKKYFFTPVGDREFDWQYEQHACMMLPDGDVFVFDNGHYRAKSPEKYLLAKDNFSRGVRSLLEDDRSNSIMGRGLTNPLLSGNGSRRLDLNTDFNLCQFQP